MLQYQQLKDQYSKDLSKVNRRYSLLGTIRLLIALVFLASMYLYLKDNNSLFIYPAILSFLAFFYFIKIHQKTGIKRVFLKTLITINEDEITYLNKTAIPFENGEEFVLANHAYSADLDIFGPRSLFHNLNRTATYIGKVKLADLFSRQLSEEKIIANQDAIQELSNKITWRQNLLAHAKISKDSKKIYEQLLDWANYQSTKISASLNVLAFISPIIMLVLIGSYWYSGSDIIGNIIFVLFLFHLFLANLMQRKAKAEIINTHKIDEIIKDYSSILRNIEQEDFKSQRLNALKAHLSNDSTQASGEFQKLSGLFSRIDNIQNLIGGIVLNGLFLYHIHTLKKIVAWKKENAEKVSSWLQVLGEYEALNSMANFSFNNPEFIFPTLNPHFEISFDNLGHPLIDEQKRVCNSISFKEHKFVILTGSNMSGKSTFLRTLGVNMILSGIGAPICAEAANIHPLPVFVSMGQADSLADNESYFFAEVKRLKYIMDQLDQQTCFILLDEILRGTNSDDKRNGTIGVIEKIIQKNAIGAIATHDLEVCLTTQEHPNVLINKCFEVEIINDELTFDYKLRNGICKNKSATFLMKKMKIIA